MLDRPQLRTLLIVVGLSIAIRGIVLFAASDRFVADPDAYRSIAITIDQHGVFGLTSPLGEPRAIAFRPPLYPWILSWIVMDGELSRAAIGWLHLILGTLTATLVYLASRRLLLSLNHSVSSASLDRLSVLAATLTLLDPILLRQSTEIMTETLAAFLAIAVIGCDSLGCLDRSRTSKRKWQPVALGGLLALAYLCRPTFLVWGLLITGILFTRQPYRVGAYRGATILIIILVTVAGWTFRNRNAIGHPVWATTHGGYTLLLANNELFYDYLQDEDGSRRPWDASKFLNAYQHRYQGDPRTAEFWTRDWTGPADFSAAISEYHDDRLCQESALATIGRHPQTFLWSSVVRVSRLWSPLPHEIAGRQPVVVWGVGAFYAVWMLAILVAIVRHRKAIFARRWWTIWLLLFTLSVVHAIYWSNLRMRAPAMPALAILAVAAVIPRRKESDSK